MIVIARASDKSDFLWLASCDDFDLSFGRSDKLDPCVDTAASSGRLP